MLQDSAPHFDLFALSEDPAFTNQAVNMRQMRFEPDGTANFKVPPHPASYYAVFDFLSLGSWAVLRWALLFCQDTN